MEGIEMMARREALGLDRADMARVVGCDLALVAEFEEGRQPVLAHVEARLAALEFVRDQISGVLQRHLAPPVLTTYTSDDDFWQAWPDMDGVPACVHRVATADALRSLTWAGVEARIDVNVIGD